MFHSWEMASTWIAPNYLALSSDLHCNLPAGYPDVPPMPQTKYVQSQTDLLPPQNLFFHLTPQHLWMMLLLCWVINPNCHSPLSLMNEAFALIHSYIPVWTSQNPISHKSFPSNIPCFLPVQYPHPLAFLSSHIPCWEPLLIEENCWYRLYSKPAFISF